METKKFHISDVLSVITDVLVSVRGMDGLIDILDFMTGDRVFTHQISMAIEECKPYLIVQFPQLDTPEIDFAAAELVEMFKAGTGKTDTKMLILGWLSKLTSGSYGVHVDENVDVARLPHGIHKRIDPV